MEDIMDLFNGDFEKALEGIGDLTKDQIKDLEKFINSNKDLINDDVAKAYGADNKEGLE